MFRDFRPERTPRGILARTVQLVAGFVALAVGAALGLWLGAWLAIQITVAVLS